MIRKKTQQEEKKYLLIYFSIIGQI